MTPLTWNVPLETSRCLSLSWSEQGQGNNCYGHRVSFGGSENALELKRGGGCITLEINYVLNATELVPSKTVNPMLFHKFYVNFLKKGNSNNKHIILIHVQKKPQKG